MLLPSVINLPWQIHKLLQDAYDSQIHLYDKGSGGVQTCSIDTQIRQVLLRVSYVPPKRLPPPDNRLVEGSGSSKTPFIHKFSLPQLKRNGDTLLLNPGPES